MKTSKKEQRRKMDLVTSLFKLGVSLPTIQSVSRLSKITVEKYLRLRGFNPIVFTKSPPKSRREEILQAHILCMNGTQIAYDLGITRQAVSLYLISMGIYKRKNWNYGIKKSKTIPTSSDR